MRACLVLLLLTIFSFAVDASTINVPNATSTIGGHAHVKYAARTPIFNPWFYGDANIDAYISKAGRNGVHPGIGPITVADYTHAASVVAAGYEVMLGIGGAAALYIQNIDANGNPNPTLYAYQTNNIDAMLATGATWIYVDETAGAPNVPAGTGLQDPGTPASVAFNVKGYNIIWQYIHSKCPKCKFGLTNGDNADAAGGSPALHLAMLRYAKTAGPNGTPLSFEDFASSEEYHSCCNTLNYAVVTPLFQMKSEFPNVLRMQLTDTTESLCQGGGGYPPTPTQSDLFNIYGAWDVDLYGNWVGPMIDASFLNNFDQFAQTKAKNFCLLPYAWTDPGNWTFAAQTANFTINVDDNFWQNGFLPVVAPAYTIGVCQYQVIAGSGAVNGPNDPSLVITVPWTNRTCNSPITITIGTGNMCNVSGTYTCQVWTRNFTTTGLVGDTTYTLWNITF